MPLDGVWEGYLPRNRATDTSRRKWPRLKKRVKVERKGGKRKKREKRGREKASE